MKKISKLKKVPCYSIPLIDQTMEQTKITKYKWIRGGGNYNLEVSLELQLDKSDGSSGVSSSSSSSSGSISKQIQLGHGVDKDKYFEGVGVNKSMTQQQFKDYLYKAFASFTINNLYSYKKDKKQWGTFSFFKHYLFGKQGFIDLEKDAGLGNDFVRIFNESGKGATGSKVQDFLKNSFQFFENNQDTQKGVQYTLKDDKGNKLFPSGKFHSNLPADTYWLMQKSYSGIFTVPVPLDPSIISKDGIKGIGITRINIDPILSKVAKKAKDLILKVSIKIPGGKKVSLPKASSVIKEVDVGKFTALQNVNIHMDYEIVSMSLDHSSNVKEYSIKINYSFVDEIFGDNNELFRIFKVIDFFFNDFAKENSYQINHKWSETLVLDGDYNFIRVE